MPTDAIRILEASAYENYKHVPDYSVIPTIDAIQQESDQLLSPKEAQLLSDMLTYFFFNKLEQNITELTIEKLDLISKSLKQSTTNINRKQLFDLNLPSKLKKNM